MSFEGNDSNEAFKKPQQKAGDIENSRSDRKENGVFSFDLRQQQQHSNNTPPIQASISPDIACGKYTPQTPACFAMGHLVSGLPNRRCRAKGILKVGGCRQESAAEPLGVPPLTKASIEWLSQNQSVVRLSGSSFGCEASLTDTPDETTANRFLSSPSDAGWRYLLEGEDAPRSGATSSPPALLVWRTPTPSPGSSCSPFTSILKRAADWSDCCKGLGRREEKIGNGKQHDGYREFASASNNVTSNAIAWSPSSSHWDGEGEEVQILTSSSLQNRSLSVPRSCSLLPEVSFQIWCPGSSESNHTTNVRKSLFSQILEKNEQQLLPYPDSELRVSWRDGLPSRILDMDETDCCLGFSNMEGDSICCPKANENIINQEQSSTVDDLEETQHRSTNRAQDGQGINEKIPSPAHAFLPENPSRQLDGPVCSSGSDWSAFFKNQLFQR